MGLFDGLIDTAITTFVGSGARVAGATLAGKLFGDDKKSTAAAAPTTSGVSSKDTVKSPLEGMEEPRVPTGEGFVKGIVSRPPRTQVYEDRNLTQALYENVMTSPPASPKLSGVISKMVSMSNVTSSGSSRKAFQKLLKT